MAWGCTHCPGRQSPCLSFSRLRCLTWTCFDLGTLLPLLEFGIAPDLILVGKCLHTYPSQRKGNFLLAVKACPLERLCLLLHSSLTIGGAFLCLLLERSKHRPFSDGFQESAVIPRRSLAGMGHDTASGCCRERIARCGAGGVKHPSQPLCLRRFLI